MVRERERELTIHQHQRQKSVHGYWPLDIQCKIRKKLETKTQILYTHEFNNIPEIIKIHIIKKWIT